jgi:asparagine synthase (glutamine-hydrolysing)
MATSVDYIQRQASEHQVEVRFPFLDRDLVTWVLRLPFEYWPPPDRSQRLHRDALIHELPEEISGRRNKAEFSSAYLLRLRKGAKAIQRLFEDGAWASEAYVQKSKARGMFDAALNAGGDIFPDSPAIWRIATVEAWLRAVFGYSPHRGR